MRLNIIKQYNLVFVFLFLLTQMTLNAQCGGDNTFLGTTSSNWNTSSNWSEGCVPTSPVSGFISIEANCVLTGSAPYLFNSNSIFQIGNGKTFTNNSSGVWTMNGTVQGTGKYIGNVAIGGTLKTVYVLPPVGINGSITYAGQTYATVLMPDGRWWMAENLNVGTMLFTPTNQTNNGVIQKYCYNNNATNCVNYGGLYQWSEAMQYNSSDPKGICPSGWHIPTATEFDELESAMPSIDKGSQLAGNEPLWNNGVLDQSPYFASTDFNVIPSGTYLPYSNEYSTLNYNAYFWTSTESNSTHAAMRYIVSHATNIAYSTSYLKLVGKSIRCVKD